MPRRRKKNAEPWWLLPAAIAVILILVFNLYRTGVGELERFGSRPPPQATQQR